MVSSVSNVVTGVMSQSITQQETTSRPTVKNENSVQNHFSREKEALTASQLKERLVEMTEVMNRFISPMHTSLKFELHDQLNEYYVSVVDDQTGTVVREIPPKKMLDMYAAMIENMSLFVDRKI